MGELTVQGLSRQICAYRTSLGKTDDKNSASAEELSAYGLRIEDVPNTDNEPGTRSAQELEAFFQLASGVKIKIGGKTFVVNRGKLEEQKQEGQIGPVGPQPRKAAGKVPIPASSDSEPKDRMEEALFLVRTLYGDQTLPAEIDGKMDGVCEFLDRELHKVRIINGQRVTGLIVIDAEFKRNMDAITGIKSTDAAFEAAFGDQNGKLGSENDAFTLEGFIDRLRLLSAIFANRQKVTQGKETFRAFLRRSKIKVLPTSGVGRKQAGFIRNIPGKVEDPRSTFGLYLREACQTYVLMGRNEQEREMRAKVVEDILRNKRYLDLPDTIWTLIYDAESQEIEYAALRHKVKVDQNIDWKKIDPKTGKTLLEDYYEGIVEQWINEKKLPAEITERSIRAIAQKRRAMRPPEQQDTAGKIPTPDN